MGLTCFTSSGFHKDNCYQTNNYFNVDLLAEELSCCYLPWHAWQKRPLVLFPPDMPLFGTDDDEPSSFFVRILIFYCTETLSSLFATSAVPSFSSAVQGDAHSSGNIVVNQQRKKYRSTSHGAAASSTRATTRSASRTNNTGGVSPVGGGRGGSHGKPVGGSMTRSERIR